jgi:hypothetical protein
MSIHDYEIREDGTLTMHGVVLDSQGRRARERMKVLRLLARNAIDLMERGNADAETANSAVCRAAEALERMQSPATRDAIAKAACEQTNAEFARDFAEIASACGMTTDQLHRRIDEEGA